MSVTKVELAELVCGQMKIEKKESADLVDMFFEELKIALANEGEIQLSGFGKFAVKAKKERNGRNPQTKTPLTISERKVVSFHHSQVLKDRLNNK